ncbi:hypothetical protein C8R47DRAFT_1068973 [Mycena vitilis]|nr:hypothetical protein C8R47DRAFT_1068973 [Mycena vitilis]
MPVRRAPQINPRPIRELRGEKFQGLDDLIGGWTFCWYFPRHRFRYRGKDSGIGVDLKQSSAENFVLTTSLLGARCAPILLIRTWPNNGTFLLCSTRSQRKPLRLLALLTASKLGGPAVTLACDSLTPFGSYPLTRQTFTGLPSAHPTKVDTLGTTYNLAGQTSTDVPTSSQDRHRDAPPHFAERSGHSTADSEAASRRVSVAFGSRVPPTTQTRTAFPTPADPSIAGNHSLNLASSTPSRELTEHEIQSTVASAPSLQRRHSAPPSTPLISRRTPSQQHEDRVVLSPIPERAADSNELQSLMDDSRDSRDQSFGAETSHVQTEGTAITPQEFLRRSFYKDDDENLEDEEQPLSQTILLLCGKMTLADFDIEDIGQQGGYRCRLVLPILDKVCQVANDLQWYLGEAAQLNPDRQKFFRVDPGNALIPSLEGATDPEQVRIAWDLLRTRLELGRRFFDKYLVQVDGAYLGSPTSTKSSVLNGFEQLPSTDLKLRHMITYYPHHKDNLPSARERLQNWTAGWTPLLERRASASPRREEQIPSPGQSFEYPVDASKVTQRWGKQREEGEGSSDNPAKDLSNERNRVFSPLPPERSALNLIPAQSYPSPSKPTTLPKPIDADSTLLGPTVRFKSSSAFLDQMASQSTVAVNAVPEAKNEPNVLERLLAGPIGSKGQHFRATFGEGSSPQFPQTPASARSYPIRFPTGPTADSENWRSRPAVGTRYLQSQSPPAVRTAMVSSSPIPLGKELTSAIAESERNAAGTGAYVPPPLRFMSDGGGTDVQAAQIVRTSTPLANRQNLPAQSSNLPKSFTPPRNSSPLGSSGPSGGGGGGGGGGYGGGHGGGGPPGGGPAGGGYGGGGPPGGALKALGFSADRDKPRAPVRQAHFSSAEDDPVDREVIEREPEEEDEDQVPRSNDEETLASAAIDFSPLNGSGFETASSTTEVAKYKTAESEESISSTFPPPCIDEEEGDRAGANLDPQRTDPMDHGLDTELDLVKDTCEVKERRRSLKIPRMEEVPDEDDAPRRESPGNSDVILEAIDEETEEVPVIESVKPKDWQSAQRAREAARQSKVAEEFWLNDGRLFPTEPSESFEEEDFDLESEESEWREALATARKEAIDRENKQEQAEFAPPTELKPIPAEVVVSLQSSPRTVQIPNAKLAETSRA